MAKVGNIVKTLFDNGNIDNMTYKWLSSGQKPPRIPEFYTLIKIHKNTAVGRPIVLVAVAQQNASPVLLILFYNQSLKNKSQISKTLTTYQLH